jgi:Ca2+-transporting ATPase
VPVNKNAAVLLDQDILLGDRKNSAFMSTLVSYGRGKGLITATGINTQINLIAEMLQSYEEEPTPLQMKRDMLAKRLGVICLAICGVILVYGLLRNTHPAMIFEKGILAHLSAVKKNTVELFTGISIKITDAFNQE